MHDLNDVAHLDLGSALWAPDASTGVAESQATHVLGVREAQWSSVNVEGHLGRDDKEDCSDCAEEFLAVLTCRLVSKEEKEPG